MSNSYFLLWFSVLLQPFTIRSGMNKHDFTISFIWENSRLVHQDFWPHGQGQWLYWDTSLYLSMWQRNIVGVSKISNQFTLWITPVGHCTGGSALVTGTLKGEVLSEAHGRKTEDLQYRIDSWVVGWVWKQEMALSRCCGPGTALAALEGLTSAWSACWSKTVKCTPNSSELTRQAHL